MASQREIADRGGRGLITRRPDPHVTPYPSHPAAVQSPRRHHFHDVPPWPHQHHRDYVYVDRGGWWPRWYPYWDPSWYVYWWQLYDYYGGDAYSDYAAYARDAFLRQYGPQWGLVISGDYGQTQVGIQPYGVASTEKYYRHDVASLRARALDKARRIYAAIETPYVGLRSTPWGGEVVAFGQRVGLQRWANEQAADTDVWYAVAFDLRASTTPFAEVAR